MLRNNVRGQISSDFDDFMSRARLHENSAESMLARAFLQELGTDYSYLKVRDDHVEAVQEFLKPIDEMPAEDASGPIGRPKLLAFKQANQAMPAHASETA